MQGSQQVVRPARPRDFLSYVGRALRRARPRFTPPSSSVRTYGPDYAEIWFPTGGCRWDFRGSCTMCNYGHPERVAPERMVAAVEEGLSSLEVMPRTLWVSSFNVLDDHEVPREVRRRIFERIAQTSAETVICESHPDTIVADAVAECAQLIPGKTFGVEIGLETTDPLVRHWCLNKPFEQPEVRTAVSAIHASGAICYANLLLGAPFLSAVETVDDVVRSVDEAAAAGVDRFVVFPNHVKPYTLVSWLYGRGLYKPPSLWSLVEVLRRIDPQVRERVYYAWLGAVDHPGRAEGITPRSDPEVHEALIAHLTGYLADRHPAHLAWVFGAETDERTRWREEISFIDPRSLVERLLEVYPVIGRGVLGDVWWEANGESVLRAVANDFTSAADAASQPRPPSVTQPTQRR